MRKSILLLSISLSLVAFTYSQSPVIWTSADMYMALRKLNVLGSVLYVGAHPDDENNGLLPYFAKEKLYRTAYLSLTRGDGGQNLIGSEQGIELGLIRTQELLAARRVDGCEQYFSTAYEFGFSKSTDEALRFWDKEKILSDVVWVIRQFQPDIIIKRFPPDSRAGHGHHSASAVLADEAFTAAADPTRFPEQFKYGVKPWQAKRIIWNGFNFGNANTNNEGQLKIDVGGFNPLLGKSYGEIGGEARSMHKSQGEGRPRRKGPILEYFQTTGGEPLTNDLMDGIVIDWKRIPGGDKIQPMIDAITSDFKLEKPELSVAALINLYKAIKGLPAGNWQNKKLHEVQDLIEACSALFCEATTNQENVVQGDVLNVSFFLNKRKEVPAVLKNIKTEGLDSSLSVSLPANANVVINRALRVPDNKKISQPYWLEYPQTEGRFDVRDQQLIGKAENDPAFEAGFTINIGGEDFVIKRPIQYKVVDPVKGELYQPLAVLPKMELNYASENFISLNGSPVKAMVHFKSNTKGSDEYNVKQSFSKKWSNDLATFKYSSKQNAEDFTTGTFTSLGKEMNTREEINVVAQNSMSYNGYAKIISYDHIPTIIYFPTAKANLIKLDIKTAGKKIGYVVGAGDKVPEALEQMGYDVTILTEKDITDDNLKQFDAVITGIRAYNIYEYLSNRNDILNRYVENGGNLIVQYMKSNQVGLKRIKVGPYPFSVNTGSRVTEEDAKVNFLLPAHAVLNYPNKISDKDFEGWVQERSTYQAEQLDPHYEMPLGMNDKNEKEGNGSLVIANYGKGTFAYVSLVLFRELPAGAPGAYRLLANLIALNKKKAF